MKNPAGNVNTWTQLGLFPGEILEWRLTVGAMPTADHGQVQVEAWDRSTGVLTAMWSLPHVALSDLEDAVAEAVSELVLLVLAGSGPFR